MDTFRKVVFSFLLYGLVIFVFLPALCASETDARHYCEFEQTAWSPENTIALLIGVLHWPDKNLAPFDPVDREDEKLFEILINRGVRGENIVFLKDEQATLEAITQNLQLLSKKGDKSSTFLFYYAGHGDRINKGQNTYFANYDCDSNYYLNTGFAIASIAQILTENFPGKRAVLLADCCYSGSLNQVANKLAQDEIQTLVFTSAVSSNDSTGNWTFTRSLNEVLAGKPATRLDKPFITAQMAADYIGYNMKFGERQLANFYTTKHFPKDFILAKVNHPIAEGQNKQGKYFLVSWQNNDYTARVIKQKGSFSRIHYPGWGSEFDEWRETSELKEIEFVVYDINSIIEVEWEGVWYPARIIKIQDCFHFIAYEGYEDYWNEWVTSERIRLKNNE